MNEYNPIKESNKKFLNSTGLNQCIVTSITSVIMILIILIVIMKICTQIEETRRIKYIIDHLNSNQVEKVIVVTNTIAIPSYDWIITTNIVPYQDCIILPLIDKDGKTNNVNIPFIRSSVIDCNAKAIE